MRTVTFHAKAKNTPFKHFILKTFPCRSIVGLNTFAKHLYLLIIFEHAAKPWHLVLFFWTPPVPQLPKLNKQWDSQNHVSHKKRESESIQERESENIPRWKMKALKREKVKTFKRWKVKVMILNGEKWKQTKDGKWSLFMVIVKIKESTISINWIPYL